MVRLHLALSALLLANVSASGVTTTANAKSQFLSVMRKVVKDKDIQMRQAERARELTKKIASKSKNLRKLDEEYVAEEAAEAEEVEYYAAEEEEAAEEVEYYAAEEEEAEEEAEYYAAEGDAGEAEYYEEKAEYYEAEEEEAEEEEAEYYEAEEEVEEQSYYAKAWGSDDGYDYSGLTFDLSQFSLKMHSCRSLTDFDIEELNKEEQAEEKQYEKEELQEISYPFSGIPYVNFRLCPTSTCQDDGWQGCREVYGNYMVSLEDYFQLTEEHLEEELEEYCDYCNSCNYFYKYFNAQCEYYDECQTYGNVCNDGDDDGEEEVKYEEYLECTGVDKAYYQQYYNVAYQNGYNNRRTEQAEEEEDDQVYLKVFCDGSIKIGIFSDNECTNYIGQTTTIYEATGLTILEDDLEADFMNHNCIHCGKNNNKYFVVNQEKYQEMQNKDDDAEDDEDGIYDICQNMYEESAKCNAFLPKPAAEENENQYYQKNADYYEYDEEWEQTKNPFACAFMEAVQKGNIDKYGIVHLSKNAYFKDYINKVNNDYLPEGYYLTDNQFFAIVGATIFCFALAIYGIMKPNKTVQNTELKASLV